jgi:hypothetical protein
MTKKFRNRKNIDIDPRNESWVKRIAEELSITQSQLINFLIFDGLERIKDGSSSIWEHLRPGRGIRYKRRIDMDDFYDDD